MKNEWKISAADVLYEDDVLIAVNKPVGVPSQATPDPQRDHAFAAVKRFLEKRGKNHYVGLHHRLDAQTSGVLLMTKDVRVNAAISEQFQSHTIKKYYRAIAAGLTPERQYIELDNPFDIRVPIGELPGKFQKFGPDGKHRKHALTSLTCTQVVHIGDYCMASYTCRPHTGRTHQIRVHLSSIGMPIMGDALYGEHFRALRVLEPTRMCLHAEKLTIAHPLTGESLSILAPAPQAFDALVKQATKYARNAHR